MPKFFRGTILKMKLYFKRIKAGIFESHKLIHWKKLERFTMWTSRKVSQVYNQSIGFWDCQYYNNTKQKAWLLLHLFTLFHSASRSQLNFYVAIYLYKLPHAATHWQCTCCQQWRGNWSVKNYFQCFVLFSILGFM